MDLENVKPISSICFMYKKKLLFYSIVYCLLIPLSPTIMKVWGYTPSVFSLIYILAIVYLLYKYMIEFVKLLRKKDGSWKVIVREFAMVFIAIFLMWFIGGWVTTNVW